MRKERTVKTKIAPIIMSFVLLFLVCVAKAQPILERVSIDGVSGEIPVLSYEKTYTMRFTFSSHARGNQRESVVYWVMLRDRFGNVKQILDNQMITSGSFVNSFYVDRAFAIKVPKDLWDASIEFHYEIAWDSANGRMHYPNKIIFYTQKWQEPAPPADRQIPQVWEDIKVAVVYNLSTTTDYHIQKAIRTSNFKPVIYQGQAIYSQNLEYMLELQKDDGNLVLYRRSDRKALWAANHWAVGSNLYPFELWFYETGELAVVRKLKDRDQKVWVSGSYVDPNSPNGHLAKWAEILVQNDGNMVMYAAYNRETTNVLPFRTQTGGGWESPHFGFLR